MTHTSNVSIPARFVFRPFGVNWEVAQAEIVDWHMERPLASGFSNFDALAALAPHNASVIVRVTLPKIADNLLLLSRMLAGLRGFESDFKVHEFRLERDDIPPECIEPHENPETSPGIADRVFKILMCRLSEEYGSIREPQCIGRLYGINLAWNVCDRLGAGGIFHASNRIPSWCTGQTMDAS